MTLKWILILPLLYLVFVAIWQNEEIKRLFGNFHILPLQQNSWSIHLWNENHEHPSRSRVKSLRNVFDLPRDICQRMDWKEHLSICQNHMQWETRNQNKTLRTNVSNSHLELIIQNGRTPSRIRITTFDGNSIKKLQGGDYWRVNVVNADKKKKKFKMNIKMFDHGNGEYSGVFDIPYPGVYSMSVNLEYSMCEGLTDPPKNWFSKGCYYLRIKKLYLLPWVLYYT